MHVLSNAQTGRRHLFVSNTQAMADLPDTLEDMKELYETCVEVTRGWPIVLRVLSDHPPLKPPALSVHAALSALQEAAEVDDADFAPFDGFEVLPELADGPLAWIQSEMCDNEAHGQAVRDELLNRIEVPALIRKLAPQAEKELSKADPRRRKRECAATKTGEMYPLASAYTDFLERHVKITLEKWFEKQPSTPEKRGKTQSN